jgi:hypothetical protein
MARRETVPPEIILDTIPDPDTVRSWLADSIRRAALLRSLLRVAERKANYRERSASGREEAEMARG